MGKFPFGALLSKTYYYYYFFFLISPQEGSRTVSQISLLVRKLWEQTVPDLLNPRAEYFS